MKKENHHYNIPNSSIQIKGGTNVPQTALDAPSHLHTAIELHTVFNTTMQILVGDRSYLLQPFDLLLINSRAPHQVLLAEGTDHFYVKFDKDKEEPMQRSPIAKYLIRFARQEIPAVLFKAGTRMNQALTECLNVIRTEWRDQQESYDAFIKAEVHKILALLYREKVLVNPKYYSLMLLSDPTARLMPALEYIEQHYAENIALSDVATQLNLDKSYFCRLFKKATGTSFISFLNYVRCCKAEELLLSTPKSLSEIAEQTGFSSVSYFSRTFKKINHYSPQTYKRFWIREKKK